MIQRPIMIRSVSSSTLPSLSASTISCPSMFPPWSSPWCVAPVFVSFPASLCLHVSSLPTVPDSLGPWREATQRSHVVLHWVFNVYGPPAPSPPLPPSPLLEQDFNLAYLFGSLSFPIGLMNMCSDHNQSTFYSIIQYFSIFVIIHLVVL